MRSKTILIFLFLIFVFPLFLGGFTVCAQEEQAGDDIIQIDDIVNIDVYGETNLTNEYVVDIYGKISFPLIGDLKVAGLSLSQAKDLIEKKLKKYILHPQIISILRKSALSKINVTILGAVTHPGEYPIDQAMSLMQLIAIAGDFTSEANMHEVKIIHIKGDGSKELLDVDAAKILDGTTQDIMLNGNDIVSIPQYSLDQNNSVIVTGQVNKPGTYEYRPGLTLLGLIANAGDFTDDANKQHVSILRSNSDGSKDVLDVDVSDIVGGVAVDIPLNRNDIVTVPEYKLDQRNTIIIIGQVNKPGTYEYRPGLTLLGLIANAGDFTDLANKTHIKILRKQGQKSQVILIDIRKILNGKMTDVDLEPNDVVSVPESFF